MPEPTVDVIEAAKNFNSHIKEADLHCRQAQAAFLLGQLDLRFGAPVNEPTRYEQWLDKHYTEVISADQP